MPDPASALKLCLLYFECICQGTPSRGGVRGHRFSGSCTCCRDSCLGTGRVPLLELPDEQGKSLLRLVCWGEGFRYKVRPGKPLWDALELEECAGGTCSLCQGRGWVPATDPWVYVRAACTVGRKIEVYPYSVGQAVSYALADDQDPSEAAFNVVASVLLEGEACLTFKP